MNTRTRLALSLVALTLASLIAAPAALANDRDVRATPVPAPICQPASIWHANRLRLSNAAWVFRGNYTGTVTLYCAVTFNAITESNTSDDNDIGGYRVYYRDSDGTSTNAQVRVRLLYRRSNGLYSAGNYWNSNDMLSGNSGNTIAYKTLNHDVRGAALYSFLVEMTRTSTSQGPAFSGIDFTTPPVP